MRSRTPLQKVGPKILFGEGEVTRRTTSGRAVRRSPLSGYRIRLTRRCVVVVVLYYAWGWSPCTIRPAHASQRVGWATDGVDRWQNERTPAPTPSLKFTTSLLLFGPYYSIIIVPNSKATRAPQTSFADRKSEIFIDEDDICA